VGFGQRGIFFAKNAQWLHQTEMPIYEYYCPENHTIYQFFAKTLAQGQTTPPCPENPKFKLQKVVSSFAINRGAKATETAGPNEPASGSPDDARIESAMAAMENEFAGADENDPRAMARMMRRMSEITGEKIDGEMEEVVRKLEEGVDPDSLEDQLGGDAGSAGDDDPYGAGPDMPATPELREKKHRFKARRSEPRRDPALYDYPVNS